MQKKEDTKLLERAKEVVSQCDRCGACLPACPLFGARDVESASARGKNMIARALAEGCLEPEAELLAGVNFCLLCRACVEVCPNQVKTDAAMIDVRQYLTDQSKGKNLRYRLPAFLLKTPALVRIAAGGLSFLRKVGLNGLVPYGMAPDEFTRAKFLAAFAGPAAFGSKASPLRAVIKDTARVAYFQGCGMQMIFPEASMRTQEILATLTPVVWKNNVCCGLPHLAHGMRREFLALARQNIDLYEDADIIVSDCASCSGTLKHIGSYFNDDPLWKDRASAFSAKVADLTEYLVRAGYTPLRTAGLRFTYHDPCHLIRGQGIREEPRQLLEQAGQFIEMGEAGTCCGGAGTFHMDYPEIASKILAKKRQNIEQTGAAVVVTACPGCLIQLTKAAGASGNKFKAMHISQVI